MSRSALPLLAWLLAWLPVSLLAGCGEQGETPAPDPVFDEILQAATGAQRKPPTGTKCLGMFLISRFSPG